MSKQTIQPSPPITPTIPVGTILAFTGNTANIPSGWILCNEQGITSLPQNSQIKVPKLDGLTLIGQGINYSLTQTGGAATHTLLTSEVPSHSHTLGSWFGNAGIGFEQQKGGQVPYIMQGFNNNGTQFSTDPQGKGHAFSIMQPYYVVYYIMYIGKATSNGLYVS